MRQFFVSVTGCNTNPGTRQAPFATISQAQKAVREYTAHGLTEPITVTVLEGIYTIDCLTFGAADSGTAECPITYTAEGKVSLCGGRKLHITDFSPLNEAEKAVCTGMPLRKWSKPI